MLTHYRFQDVQVGLVNSDILGSANGAYAQSVNTIFLGNEFVKSNSVEAIAQVLTEEFGHFVDAQVNKADSEGDEGEIFKDLVFNQPIPSEELTRLKAENDHGFIQLNNQLIAIEKSAFQVTNNIGEILAINKDTTLVFQWAEREAGYNNEVGIIVFDNPEGKIDGMLPQDKDYVEKLLTSGRNQVIFTKGNSAGNWKEIDFKTGDYIGFYLVQNASTTEYLSNPSSVNIFSSITALNKDSFDHVNSTNIGGGIYRFNWEDLTGGGDRDFNDVVLNVAESGFKAGNSTQLVPLTVEFISRDASYLNEVGYYLVDDVKGTINGVSPNDPNYSKQVFKEENYQVVFEPDNYGGSREYTLKGGQYIGWYLISNSSSKKYLETNPTNDPNGNVVAYFSYASANPDDLNYFIYKSGNQLAWEDILGGGDKDYNDIVFTYNFGNPRENNNPPVVDTNKIITLAENSQPIELNINTPTDINGDNLTISVNQLPTITKGLVTKKDGSQVNVNDTLTIDDLTNLRFTPVLDANGNGGDFVYTVADGKGSSGQTISFDIAANRIVSLTVSNTAPEFISNPKLQVVVGKSYKYDADAIDKENDSLFYSLLIAPDGLTIDNSTGVLSWETPTLGNHNISVLVEDGKGGRDLQEFSLSVVIDQQLNRPPVFVSTPVVYSNINKEYKYKALATDADSDNLTYSIIAAPEGFAVDKNAGIITWTPAKLGEVDITLQVEDGNGGIANQKFSILVQPEETDNYAPVIITEPVIKASTSQSYIYDVNALDPDDTDLIYSLVTAPQGMTINASTGEIVWDTATKTVGDYIVTVKVSDNRGGVDTQEFIVKLDNIPFGTIEGFKWDDANGNGIFDSASFEDFSVGVSTISLNGNTKIVNSGGKDVLRVTEARTFVSGNALLKNPFNLLAGNGEKLSFSTNFSFSISGSGGLGDSDGAGADGLTFIISPTANIGSSGGGIGYGGLNKSVVVELDTFNNGAQDRNNGNSIGINLNGNLTSIAQTNIATRFNNGEIWNVWVDYNGTSKVLEARVTQSSIRPTEPTVSATVDIPSILGQDEFFVGFTSATGGGVGNHDILSWRFATDEPPLAGVKVYLDSNKNGTFDNEEPTQITDESGKYKFTGLEAGTYVVREVVPTDFEQTFPSFLEEKVILNFDDLNSGAQPGNVLENRGVMFSSGTIPDNINVGNTFTFQSPSLDFQIFSNGDSISPPNFFVVNGGGTKDALLSFPKPVLSVSLTSDDNSRESRDTIRLIALSSTGNLNEFKVLAFDEAFDNATTSPDNLLSIDLGGLPFSYAIFQTITEAEGFDDLTFTIASNPDFYTVKLDAGKTVSNINFGNKKIVRPNEVPIFTSSAPTTAKIGELLTYQAKASDPNNDNLTYSLLTKPVGMAVDARTGILIWQPKLNQVGNNRVVLQVSDGKGGINTQEFILNTRGVNIPPQIVSSPDTFALLNDNYTYEVRATDPDRDTFTYSLINPPQGMTINASTGLIEYKADRLGIRTIEIKVEDGFGGSNTQSYQLQVLENVSNRLPSITSTPQVLIGSGGLYQYDVNATDPENTTITYGLTVKPDGMTIDATTGLISWQTQPSISGDFQVTVSATDANGGKAFQNYFIRVAPNQIPVISSTPVELVQLGSVYEYDITAADADGDRLNYTLTQAPEGLTIDQFGRIRSKNLVKGIYPVVVQVDDGRGGIVSQSFDLTVADGDITKPEVKIGFSSNVINLGETSNLQILATDNIDVKTLTLTANGKPLTLNPDVPNGQINTGNFVGQAAGLYKIVGTATDEAGNVGTKTIEVRVVDPSDTESPVVELDLTNLQPTQGVISKPTDIIATVTDKNLEFYRVEIAPVSAINLDSPGEDDPDYTLLKEGNVNINKQVVTTIDPRLLANGSYFVRVKAFDFSGNGNVRGVVVNVSGQNKPGDFSLEFTDLSIPLTGIPIDITRRYNSLESSTQGDFGFGWKLGLQDANIVEASPDGRDLSDKNSSIFNTSNAFSVGTRVTLNIPDGRRVGFTFNPVVSGASFLGAIYAPSFTPDAGVFDKLEADGGNLTVRSDGKVGAFLFSFLGYNPTVYKLTTRDGTVYRYDQNFGLIEVRDRNGNLLTFSDKGITSSTGAKVEFKRDAQNRITEIIDPEGKSIKYSYDAKGDLVRFSDRTNNTTELAYGDPSRQHFLTEVKDPLGRSTTRTEYDANGQIRKIIDANGNELAINFDAAASSQSIRDPFGKIITRVFDDRGNVIQEVDQLGGITLRTYDANNNLLSIKDPLGNTSTYTYDSKGNLLTETNGLNQTTTYTYSDLNKVLTKTDPLGNKTQNSYDSKGNLLSTTNAAGKITSYVYDSRGNATTVTSPQSDVTRYEYDSQGRITAIIDALNQKSQLIYDNNGNLLSITTPLGNITKFAYDSENRPTTVTDALGNISRIEYNALGDRIAKIDALGRRQEYSYDSRRNLTAILYADGTTEQFTYDALERRTSSTDRAGRTTTFVYDALGRLVERILPDSTPNTLADNPRTQRQYDAVGRLTAFIDELGNRTEYGYDAAGRQTVLRDALGNLISNAYDAAGQLTKVTDALNRNTQFVYDPLGQVVQSLLPDGTKTITTYDALQRVIAETDQAGVTTQYEYDALDRLTAVVDALGQRTEYGYDAEGNQVSQKDAKGNTTTYQYDAVNQRLTTILPLGQRSTQTYDPVGNILSATDFNGKTINYIYNSNDQIITEGFADGTSNNYTYTPNLLRASVTDARGVTKYNYDERDRLITRTEVDGRTINYSYDLAGNRTSVTTPAGSVGYSFDALNRMQTVTDRNAGITKYTYDAVGNLVRTELPNNVVETRQYDSLDRLIAVEQKSASGVIAGFEYTLGAVGNRLAVKEASGRQVNYTYDKLYRLVTEAISDSTAGNRTISYTYDPTGDRLTRNDSVEGITTYTYDNNDRLLKEILNGTVTEYTYDENGSTLSVKVNGVDQVNYKWDDQGRLIAVDIVTAQGTDRIQYRYDADGNRVTIIVNGQETRYLLDTEEAYTQVVEEYAPDGTTKKSYVYGLDLISQEENGKQSFHLAAGLGSVNVLTDINGNVTDRYIYDAFGVVIGRQGNTDNLYRFTGEQFDENSDLYYLRARYYNPENGRFISRDSFEGFNEEPLSLNKYSYVSNNSINLIDPSGNVEALEYSLLTRIILVSSAPAFFLLSIKIQDLFKKIGIELDNAILNNLNNLPNNSSPKPGSGAPNASGASGAPDASGASVEDILKGSTPGKESSTKQKIKPGGANQANEDFDKLPGGSGVDRGDGKRTKTLPDGTKVTVRPNSTEGSPTLQIIPPTGRPIKIRYK